MIKFWLAKMAAEFIGLVAIWAIVVIIGAISMWRHK